MEGLFRLRKPLVKRTRLGKLSDCKQASDDSLPSPSVAPIPPLDDRVSHLKESPKFSRSKVSPKILFQKKSPKLAQVRKSPRLAHLGKSPRQTYFTKSPRQTHLRKSPRLAVLKESPNLIRFNQSLTSPKVPVVEGSIHTPVRPSRQPVPKASPAVVKVEEKVSVKGLRSNQITVTLRSPRTPVIPKQSPRLRYLHTDAIAMPLPALFDEDDDDDICEIRNDRRVFPGNDPFMDSLVNLFVEGSPGQ